MNDILKRIDGEDENTCLYRIGSNKDFLGLTWDTISDWMNENWRGDESEYRTESAYRKKYRNMAEARSMFDRQAAVNNGNVDEYTIQMRELEKAKIKLRDERTDYQKSLREDARRESFIELIERKIAESVVPFEYKQSPIINGNEDMIVCLSDLHAGIEIQNWWNVYNTGVLRQRLYKYLDEIINIQDTHQCKICNVVLGGDNVSGLIHPNLRLQNNENVVEQIKVASTYIGEFVYVLQEHFDSINVYSVSGNHSRLSQSKEEHIKGEELDGLIPFYLNLQFAKNDKVQIHEINIDDTVGSFITRGGKVFYICHGDKDTPSSVVKNLTLMIGQKPDAIIMGHRHQNSLNTEHKVKIVQCGCVVGTDDYCVDKRISGDPEQCVLITNDRQAVRCLYDICLK